MYTIRQINLGLEDMEKLRAEASREGFDFMETLFEQWSSGEQRFSQPGEVLCGCFDQGKLIAVGGLTIDPFCESPEVGRIRRVYVRAAWRNRGIGRMLVTHLVEEARKSFTAVRLRAESGDAARLYERMGFTPVDSADASHILHLTGSPSLPVACNTAAI